MPQPDRGPHRARAKALLAVDEPCREDTCSCEGSVRIAVEGREGPQRRALASMTGTREPLILVGRLLPSLHVGLSDAASAAGA